MKSIVVSVPGKIHLMGEHTVVYGKPAILAAINKRLFVTVTQNNKELIINSGDDPKLINKAIEVVKKYLNLDDSLKITISVKSDIPLGRHIGSSAAISVAIVSALLYFYKKIWDKELFNQLAYEVEKLQHGNPSGGDNTIVTYGGLIWFRKEQEFLKKIYQIPFKIPKNFVPFMLIDTGKPEENTGIMVKNVADFVKINPQKAQKLFEENEEATKEVFSAIKLGDEQLLIKAIQKGEKTLEGLGVVSKKIISLIREVEIADGAAKILGGGGKTGAVGLLLVYHPDKKLILKICGKYGYPLINIKLGEEGVRLENEAN